jgi:hypothetical protein
MKVKVTKEEYVLNKALTVLQESTFPKVRVGYIGDMSVLVFWYGPEIYYRNININSIGASVCELPAVTNGEFREKWQVISSEDEDFILLLDEISHLIDKNVLEHNYEMTIEM